MDKEKDLLKSKRNALLFLLTAAALFITTLFLQPDVWILGLKAIAEAAMVGALADWFAVVALFRRVPLPFIGRHTAIIPRNKDRIADNLAAFVREKFLDPASLTELIRQHNPAQVIADWLSPKNAKRLSRYLLRMMGAFLNITDDVRIQSFIRQAVSTLLDKLDLSKTMSAMLENMTKDGRHQELLDAAVLQLMKLLKQPATRDVISRQIVIWLRKEHPVKSRVLPTEWLGENGAEMVSNAVAAVLDDIGEDRDHAFRKSFDRAVETFIVRLKSDTATASKAEEIKHYLMSDPTLNNYIAQLWTDLRDWLKQDIAGGNSLLRERLNESALWLGKTLSQDEALRASLNHHLEQAANKMAPDFAEFLTLHISNTVKGWDAKEMSHQVELNIGKDLQFIRINGTIVGATIGLGLYLLSQLPRVVHLYFS
ncbi:DUF445 domain-containing protein [Brenneria uluponensis]|uniref:DUF445 domain-containing protein n=1 Tax=Brenneria uluponensis TaxID=3057057 RepID=UPI0028E662FA|nr:DUF445 family protein [Brenneria ulupoensis]